MKNKTFAVLLAAAMLGFVAVPALAGQPPRPPRGSGHGPADAEWEGRGSRRGGGGMHRMGGMRGMGCMEGMGGMGHGGGGQHDDCAGPCCADDGAMSGRRGGGPGLNPRMIAELGITGDQRAKYVDLMANNFKATLEARMDLAAARATLRDLHDADAPDANAIIEANKAIGEATGRLDALRSTQRAALESILTPEQKAMVDEWRSAPPRGGRDGFRSGPRDDSESGPRFDRGPRSGHGFEGGHGRGPGSGRDFRR